MSVCCDINALIPEMQVRVRATMKALAASGIKAMVFETNRSQEVQNAYYAQGRKPLDKVNALRCIAGLWPISEAENKNKVTETLHSRHIGGRAVDIVPVTSSGAVYWNAPFEVWKSIGMIAEKNGLDWCYGGDGKAWHWDLPHYELLENWKPMSFAEEKQKNDAAMLAKQALQAAEN